MLYTSTLNSQHLFTNRLTVENWSTADLPFLEPAWYSPMVYS